MNNLNQEQEYRLRRLLENSYVEELDMCELIELYILVRKGVQINIKLTTNVRFATIAMLERQKLLMAYNIAVEWFGVNYTNPIIN